MSGKEKNSFERELQKDPFAREASEGFASIEPNDAFEDISDLQKLLRKRVAKRRRVILYRIAASVAILMTISFLLIMIERNRAPKEIAAVTDNPEPLEIAQSLPIIAQPDKREYNRQPSGGPEKKSELSGDQLSKKQSEPPAKKTISTDYQYVDMTGKTDGKAVSESLRPEKAAAISQAAREEERPLLDEVVVTGMGVSKPYSDIESVQEAGYLPPQPSAGKSDFDRYIKDNLVWPDTTFSGQKAVVVLIFKVHTDGSIDSIKIIKSSGEQFSREAVRLLRSGPSWIPAEEDGKPVEDEVRLRIVFR